MFKPKITKEWLLATMELEGDGFCNAGGIRSNTFESDAVNGSSSVSTPIQEEEEGDLNIFIPTPRTLKPEKREQCLNVQ